MRWLFDIAAFVTRSASAWNVDPVPEESESENPSEVLQHENCVTFRPQIKGVAKELFVGCCDEGYVSWTSKKHASHQ